MRTKPLDIQRNKVKVYPIRFTEKDYFLLRDLAKKNKTTWGEAVRAIIRDFFKQKGDK